VEPPFKPKVKNENDSSNFDEEFTSEKPVVTPTDPALIASIDQEEFKGFTYVNPHFA
jgi:novel protein kinase C epsilon type